MANKLTSCDTFVVLPPLTQNGVVIFGKNSDRPTNEVQEVIYVKGEKRDSPKLKCTYIEIDESADVLHSVILSKPSWMWGAEMGSNDKNVCIGNEAVWTNYNERDGDTNEKRLLGMDLVRLGLERGSSAEDALNVITGLLEKYGQGGPCSETDSGLSYHNSFLIVDPKEAWLLETSGKFWAAEKIESGYRNISNGLTIQTKIDKMSDGLTEKAKSLNLWSGEGEFNFTKCFAADKDNERQVEGEKLVKDLCKVGSFNVTEMFKILRDKDSGICRPCNHSFPTQGSQVSTLSEVSPSVHWFTATPDPSISVYKPFVFTPNVRISQHTISPRDQPSLAHNLYKLHAKQQASQDQNTLELLKGMEEECVAELSDFLTKFAEGAATLEELDELMKDCVETEVKYYR